MFAALDQKSNRPAQPAVYISDIITAWLYTAISRNEKSEVAQIESL
ncbi:MAG TPA: hypothetical protein PKV15_02335 [Syntrophomonadaceae bacterium]|jgi:hypothetical protein|nr:hypothetical protein [Syntrophomonadaceae bacterium]HRX21193.1 hypothetical protein [Syntrophomonadaceae bacterium]